MSSVVGGYEEYRRVAKDAIECLGHVPVLMERVPASPDSPQTACLTEVENSDVVVLLMGARYGYTQPSELSATHEEWVHARSINKKVLVFVERVYDRETKQEAFVKTVEEWVDGHLRKQFSTPLELSLRIVAALRKREREMSEEDLDQDPAERLPPNCRARVEALRNIYPVTARRIVSWLSDPASRTAGALSRLLDNLPGWLIEADYHAWEAISDFMDAYGIPGSDAPRKRAIEADSPRSSLYLIEQAAAAAKQGNLAQAERLLGRVPSDSPLLAAARARINNDPASVAAELEKTGLCTSDDPDLALSSVVMLTWAYMSLERFNLAAEVLRAANQQFPGRAGLLFYQANSTLGMAKQAGLGSTSSRELLAEVVEIALRSRDCFRLWDGPSHHAVALATQALLLLEDSQKVVDLSSVEPKGESTASEANDPAVRRNLTFANMMPGQRDANDTTGLEGIEDPFERTFIQGVQAQKVSDAAAASLLRRALAKADDYPSRRKALWGLAMCGKIDEAALAKSTEADAALFRGVAAFHRGHMPEAINCLRPYRLESVFHATYLARTQDQSGDGDEAVETLLNAAEHLEDVSLYVSAVEILVKNGRFDKAEPIATKALAQSLSPGERHRLRTLLVSIAQGLENWQMVDSYARALIGESSQNQWAAWMVVYALHRQGRNQPAWDYLVRNDLIPYNEKTARLATTVCRAVDATTHDAERLLNIAGTYTDTEEVVGTALMTLMTASDHIRLRESQRTRLSELMEGFVARYPQSDILQVYSAESPEEIMEKLATLQQPHSEQVRRLIEKVRYGILPYGVLLWAHALPYAAVQMSLKAGWLTAIPADKDRRDRERQAAREALGGKVVVDTSVAVLGVTSGLDLRQLSDEFKVVLVTDELVSDARTAVTWAKEPVVAFTGYDSVLDQPTITEIDEGQRRAMIEKAESVSEILSGWQQTRSGHLPPPVHLGAEERFKPWDSSVRVSSTDGCALWCDDLGLRTMAESEGIPTFGTWALLEALSSTPESTWPAPTTEMKMRLLRAQIADVPISLNDLSQTVDESDASNIAVNCLLARPHVWIENPSDTFGWCLERVRELCQGPHRQRVMGLLQAVCYGWGTVVPMSAQRAVVGGALGGAILIVSDPAMTPQLLTASRYATHELDPRAKPDPLPEAAHKMLKFLETAIGPNRAAQRLILLFSEAEPADRHVVASIVFSDR